MRKNLIVVALGLAAAVCSSVALEREASACGGCFSPPTTENPTVVTDHRMILSISQDQSTLYDQIKYSGNPAAFAWVLPIVGHRRRRAQRRRRLRDARRRNDDEHHRAPAELSAAADVQLPR